MGEVQREKESLADSTLSEEPEVGLDLTTLRTRAKTEDQTLNRLCHTGTPRALHFKNSNVNESTGKESILAEWQKINN